MSSSRPLETRIVEPSLTLGSSQSPIVLLVDDCLEDRKTIARYLLARPDSYKILEASTVSEGLDLYQRCQPDIVLLDYQLPDSDGLEFLEQIQQSENEDCPPVILLTGQGNEQVAVQAMKAGVCDYLVKGQIEPQQLQTVVNYAIENAQLRAQLRQERVDRDLQIEQEKLIAQIANQIHSRLDVDEILNATVSEVRQFLRCDRVLIYRFRPDRSRVVVAESVGDGWLSILNAQVEDADFIQTRFEDYRLGRILVIADIYSANLTESHIELLERFQIRAKLAVPIWQEDSLWGLLVANQCSGSRQWQPQNIELLEQLTTQVGIALKQAQLYEQVQIELSDRQKAQEALRQSQETIRRQLSEIESIYITAPIGLCFIDTDLRFVRINEQLAQINGLPVSEHIGRTLREILPEMADSLEPLYRQVIESGEPILNLEVSGTNRAQPGVKRDWLTSYYPQKDSSDRVLGVNVMVQEITDRKRAEEQLRESNAILNAINQATTTLIYAKDRQGRLLMANPATIALNGKPEEEILGHNDLEFFSNSEEAEQIMANDRQVMETGRVHTFEEQAKTLSGKRIYLSTKSPYLDEAGNVIGLIGVSTEITDRKQVEKNLRESEEFIRSVFNSSPDCIKILDTEGNIISMNVPGMGLMEIEDFSSFLGKNWTTFWQDEARKTALDAIATAKANGIGRFQGFCPTMKGTPKWWDIIVTPVTDAQGRVIRLVATSRDITERKQAEQQLQQQTEKLIQLNAAYEQTTAQLTERNQELDRFTYTVSHDLKAPLRAIANLAQWISDDLEGQLSEENQHNMELLQQRVARMESLINGLLAYSRIGRTEVASQKVNVGELISETIDSLAPPATFTISVSQMPTIVAKRLLLSQVFSNLIGNAIKHCNRPDGQIEICATQKEKYYEFSVADNGPGIAPENHERIFGIFQTLKGRDTQENTGIGLSIVKKIIETEGGEITLESELGRGATFRFTWPFFQ